MFDHHVTSGRRARYVLEVLPHQAVTTARVGSIHDLGLLLTVAGSVARLLAEKEIFIALVAIDVLRSQESQLIVHVYQAISAVEDVARLGENVTRPLCRNVLREGAEGVIQAARRERGEVRIYVKVVKSHGQGEDRLAHIIVESFVNPALCQELFPNLDEVIAM